MTLSLSGRIYPLTPDIAELTVHVLKEGDVWNLIPWGNDNKRLYLGDIQPTLKDGKYVFDVVVGKTCVVVTVDVDGGPSTLFYDHGKCDRTITIQMDPVPKTWDIHSSAASRFRKYLGNEIKGVDFKRGE